MVTVYLLKLPVLLFDLVHHSFKHTTEYILVAKYIRDGHVKAIAHIRHIGNCRSWG